MCICWSCWLGHAGLHFLVVFNADAHRPDGIVCTAAGLTCWLWHVILKLVNLCDMNASGGWTCQAVSAVICLSTPLWPPRVDVALLAAMQLLWLSQARLIAFFYSVAATPHQQRYSSMCSSATPQLHRACQLDHGNERRSLIRRVHGRSHSALATQLWQQQRHACGQGVQVWALQDGEDLHVGGRTNRATVTFAAEYASILDSVPERPPPPPPPAAAVAAAAAGGDPAQNGSGGLSQ